jgi:hypothetical protein
LAGVFASGGETSAEVNCFLDTWVLFGTYRVGIGRHLYLLEVVATTAPLTGCTESDDSEHFIVLRLVGITVELDRGKLRHVNRLVKLDDEVVVVSTFIIVVGVTAFGE